MMTHQKRKRAEFGEKAKHLLVPAFFLCSTLFSQAASNVVSGYAYGTNYSALATAGSIASLANTNGLLIIQYENTTSLTLSNDISGFVAIMNQSTGITVNATGATLASSEGTKATFMALSVTNLVVTDGQFMGASFVDDSDGLPAPGPDSGGGWITNSTATIYGSEFAGINYSTGLTVERSELTVSNVVIRGGDDGIGLYAFDGSTVTIDSGSFTGGVGTTAFWLQDSDATVHGGTFAGDIDGTNMVIGDGLFSELTEATTNSVNLHGGNFSSLGFFGVDGSVQNFLAGTNLVVQNGIVQNGGTVIVSNQSDTALTDILIFSGTMLFPTNTYTLMDGGSFILDGQDSAVDFYDVNIAPNATMNIGLASVTANDFFADTSSSNLLSIANNTNGLISTESAWFKTDSAVIVDAAASGISSLETNGYALISANADQLFAGATNLTPATASDFEDVVTVTTNISDRMEYVGLSVDTIGGKTFLNFKFTAQELKIYWDLTNGTSDVVTEAFADELDQLADSDMLTIIDTIGNPAQSLAATETTYFTTMNTFQTVLNGIQAAVGQSASRGAEYREQLELRPSGARGPQYQSDLRGWAKYYGQRYYHDADGLNQQYETSLDGVVIGVDKSIGALLLGLSGGYGGYSTTTDYAGEEDITAYHGSLYGTLGLDNAYIDGGIAYGFNEVETRTSSPFILNGEFDAQILSAYLGGGIALVDSTEGMVFTPEASIQYSMYEQDAYSETSDTAVPRNIDAFDADSLRGSVGLNISVQEKMKMQTFSFKYDIRFHWIREFNPDPGNMDFSLDGGNNDYQLAHPMLDEDVYRAGIGAAFFNTIRNQPKNVMFRLDFDELFGDGFNSHNLSAKVIYAF